MKLLKNRTVLGVLCIAVSLFICFAVTPLVNAGLSKKTTIVRFVKDVKAGEEIKKGLDIRYAETMEDILPVALTGKIADKKPGKKKKKAEAE